MKLRPQSSRMPTVHMQALLLVHLLEEAESNVKLTPVREYCSITSISYQLLRKLSNSRIKVIQDHVLHSSCLRRSAWYHIEWDSLEVYLRHVIEHIDVAILLKLISKDLVQLRVEILDEILEMVLDCQLLLFR